MNSFALLGYENGKADAMSARPFDATPPEHLTGKAATQSYEQGYSVGYQEIAPITGAFSFSASASTSVDPSKLSAAVQAAKSASTPSLPKAFDPLGLAGKVQTKVAIPSLPKAFDPLGLAGKMQTKAAKPQMMAPQQIATAPMALVRSAEPAPAAPAPPEKSWWAKNWWIPAAVGGVVVVGAGVAYHLRKK